MLPLLTFASGLVAGIIGVRLIKTVKAPEGLRAATSERLATINDKARHGFDQAQTGLRQATVSGLTVIEKSSASLRSKLTPTPADAQVSDDAAVLAGAEAVAEAPAEPRSEA